MKCRIKQVDLVFIELTLKNDSNEAIEIDVRHSPLDYTRFSGMRNRVFAIKYYNTKVEYKGVMAKSMAPPKWVTLQPDDKIKSIINLSTGYLLEAGTYSIYTEFYIHMKDTNLVKVKSNKIEFIIPEIEY